MSYVWSSLAGISMYTIYIFTNNKNTLSQLWLSLYVSKNAKNHPYAFIITHPALLQNPPLQEANRLLLAFCNILTSHSYGCALRLAWEILGNIRKLWPGPTALSQHIPSLLLWWALAQGWWACPTASPPILQ